jgi:hypothetical protein
MNWFQLAQDRIIKGLSDQRGETSGFVEGHLLIVRITINSYRNIGLGVGMKL